MFGNSLGSGGGGRSILGRITIDTSGVVAGTRVVTAAGRSIESAFGRTGQVVDRSSARMASGLSNVANNMRAFNTEARNFSRTGLGRDLDQIQKTTAGIAENFKLISLGAGIASLQGAKEAFGLFRANELLKAMSKNQAQVVSRQEQFRALADRTGQSYLTILEASERLLPTIGRTNIDLSQTLLLAQRLALMDPAQGVQGAAIALREALGGEARSLAFRFEIPRVMVRQAINEAGGDPQALVEALDRLVDRVGISTDAFMEMQRNGVNAFIRIRDTARNALAVAFMPLLEDFLIPAANAMSDFLQKLIDTNPQLLAAGAAILVTLAAVGPLFFGLSKLIQVFTTLRNLLVTNVQLLASMARNMASVGAKAAVVGLGVLAGGAVSQGLANAGVRTGDLGRIADGERWEDVLGERIKQILSFFVHAIEVVIVGLQRGAFIIKEVFNFLPRVMEAINLGIQEAGNNLAMTLTDVAISLSEALPFLNIDTAQLKRSKSFQENFGILLDLEQSLLKSQSDEFGSGMIGRAEEAFPGGDLTRGFINMMFPGTFQNQMEQTTTNLAGSFMRVLSSVDRFIGKMEETSSAIDEINAEFADQARRTAATRRLADTRTGEDQTLADFRSQRDFDQGQMREIDQFNRQQQLSAEKARREIDEAERDYQRERTTRTQEYNREELRRSQDHQRKLLEIRENARVQIQQAAANLDAMAVFNARQDRERKLAEENETFEITRRRRQEDFNLEMEQFAQQSIERINAMRAAEQERTRLEAEEFAIRRARAYQEFALRQQDEAEDRRIRRERLLEDRALEDELLEEQRKERLEKLREGLEEETQAVQGVNSAIISLAQTAGGQIYNFFSKVASGVGNLAKGVGDFFSGIGNTIGNIGNSIGNTIGNILPIFDSGGVPPIGQAFLSLQPELITLSQPARVLSPQDTRMMMGNGGGGINLQIETLNVPIDSIGNLSPEEAAEVVKEGLVLALADIMGSR